MKKFFLIFAFVLGVSTLPTGEEIVCVEYRSSNQPPSKICGYPVGKPDVKGFQPRFSDNSRPMEMIPEMKMTEGKNCPNCGNLLPLPYAAAGIREGRTIYIPSMKEERTGIDCGDSLTSTSPITFPSRMFPVPPKYNLLSVAEEMLGRYFNLYDRVRKLENKLKTAENQPIQTVIQTPEEKTANENPQKIASPETLQKEVQNPTEPTKN